MSEFKTRLHSVPSGGFLTDRDKDKKPILDVRELGIDFGGLTAVDNFNLMIGRNEIAGLIGPNGAGKTTVFNLLNEKTFSQIDLVHESIFRLEFQFLLNNKTLPYKMVQSHR